LNMTGHLMGGVSKVLWFVGAADEGRVIPKDTTTT